MHRWIPNPSARREAAATLCPAMPVSRGDVFFWCSPMFMSQLQSSQTVVFLRPCFLKTNFFKGFWHQLWQMAAGWFTCWSRNHWLGDRGLMGAELDNASAQQSCIKMWHCQPSYKLHSTCCKAKRRCTQSTSQFHSPNPFSFSHISAKMQR